MFIPSSTKLLEWPLFCVVTYLASKTLSKTLLQRLPWKRRTVIRFRRFWVAVTLSVKSSFQEAQLATLIMMLLAVENVFLFSSGYWQLLAIKDHLYLFILTFCCCFYFSFYSLLQAFTWCWYICFNHSLLLFKKKITNTLPKELLLLAHLKAKMFMNTFLHSNFHFPFSCDFHYSLATHIRSIYLPACLQISKSSMQESSKLVLPAAFECQLH